MAIIGIEGIICKGKGNNEAITARIVNGRNGQQTMVNFRVAVYQGKDKEGKTEYGYWQCTAFGALADNIYKGLKAGDRVTVTGTPSIESWTTQQGKKGMSPEIEVDTIGRAISQFAPKGNNQYDAAVHQAVAVVNQVKAQPANQSEFNFDDVANETEATGKEVEIPF